MNMFHHNLLLWFFLKRDLLKHLLFETWLVETSHLWCIVLFVLGTGNCSY